MVLEKDRRGLAGRNLGERIRGAENTGNATFTYEIKTAQAATLEEARNKCLAELVGHPALENGVVAISGNRSGKRFMLRNSGGYAMCFLT